MASNPSIPRASFNPFNVEFVLFDIAGTTLDDRIGDVPLIILVFQQLFSEQLNLSLSLEQINPHRGKDKKLTMKHLLMQFKYNNQCNIDDKSIKKEVEELYMVFEELLDAQLAKISKEMPGASELFHLLKQNNINIGLGSGFSNKVVESIIKSMGWDNLIDYYSSAEAVGASRPDPAMIHDVMNKFKISQPCRIVKIGDTTVDILEGLNGGCISIGITTGTQSRESLAQAKPHFIVDSLPQLAQLLQLDSKNNSISLAERYFGRSKL
jgi:phosphonatase-like hydrolase